MMLAYVDPGMGALIWQIIVAAVVGTMFYLKKTRDWLLGLFRKTPQSDPVEVADARENTKSEPEVAGGSK